MWFIIIPAGLLAAFVFHLPVLAVYFILNLDEFVKLPFVYRNYRKYKWVNNLTREKQG
jgi:Na+-driven multidrug efflux pump